MIPMKRLILRLLIALLTFLFSLIVTWLTARFVDAPKPNEVKTVGSLRAISSAQIVYSIIKGKGDFADLETLGREGLIDKQLASGEKDGYVFTLKAYPKNLQHYSLYDISAKPEMSGLIGTEVRSFYANEINIIWFRKGCEPPTGTPDRIPENGILLAQ